LDKIPRDQIERVLATTADNHRNLQEFETMANIFMTKSRFAPRAKRRRPEAVPAPMHGPVPAAEFAQFILEMEDEYRAALLGIQSYRERSGAKLRMIGDQISAVEAQLQAFEKKVSTMNEHIKLMDLDAFDLDTELEQWEAEEADGVADEELLEMLADFRGQVADMHQSIRGEVAALKSRLFEMENSPASPPSRAPAPAPQPRPEARPKSDPEDSLKASPKTDPENSPETNQESSREADREASPEASPETNAEASPEIDAEASPEASPEADAGASPETDAEASPD
jgi:hypothetical protein